MLFGSHGIFQTTDPDEASLVISPYRAFVRLLIRLGTDSGETCGYGMSALQTFWYAVLFPNGLVPSHPQLILVIFPLFQCRRCVNSILLACGVPSRRMPCFVA